MAYLSVDLFVDTPAGLGAGQIRVDVDALVLQRPSKLIEEAVVDPATHST